MKKGVKQVGMALLVTLTVLAIVGGAKQSGEVRAVKESVVLDNGRLRLEFMREGEGYANARIFAKQSRAWLNVGIWRPLMRIIFEGQRGEVDWQVKFKKVKQPDKNTLVFAERVRDQDGNEWRLQLTVALKANEPVAKLHYSWQCLSSRQVKAFWGPNLLIGEDAAKVWGLLPGLEFLYDGEPSSNPRDLAPPLHDRRTPNPKKITVPLMAVSIGKGSVAQPKTDDKFFCPDSLFDLPSIAKAMADAQPVTVTLLWNPMQKWDGEHALPSVRFESPTADGKQASHRLGLFLPSCPDFVPENAEKATKPYLLEAGKTVQLEASLAVDAGAVMVAMQRWLTEVGGLPKPNPAPRNFEEQLAIDRDGFLRTVWDEKTQKWRHCIGWAPHHTPGFATLLWFDAHITKNAKGRRKSLERVHLVAKNMLKEGGAGLFMAMTNCHILRFEFPFHYGYLPEAMPALEDLVRSIIASQQPDGSWRFHPGDERQATLGRKGDAVLGTCAHNAALLLRAARITGDVTALKAGEKALELMECFRIPRGGQTWECPMYEPDILPAAWAVAAYLEGFWATGNPRWLHNAVYWAETGLPFNYLWTLPDRPMMLGASIPVFGSTFYTHSWLGMPVQWCGLVYAYHVQRLARTLEHHRPKANGSPLPLSTKLTPKDWRRVAEHIIVSAMSQQFDEDERRGTYPDSITDFKQRNPAFINPEDIMVNVLTLHGYDPDIKTVRLKRGNAIVLISSGARIFDARWTANLLQFKLNYFLNQSSHTFIVGVRPKEVKVKGKILPRSDKPVQRDAGWWWDEQRKRLYIVVPHKSKTVSVDITF